MAKILLIDDDHMLCEMVCRKLHTLGHETVSAHTLSHGLEAAFGATFDLLLLDVRLPDGSGLEALPQFRATEYRPEVIIITGEGDPEGAELALEIGAWDYIEKPLSMREITLQITRALEYRHEKMVCRPARLLRKDGIIGSDPKLEMCLESVARSAITVAPVLITGETGTGKELFARAVHDNSRRASGPFVVLDCATVPEKLVESMLFGHHQGAFTGADRTRDGLILQADNGTLFMDEVGELPPPIQKAFLRVLQERRFRPVGGSRELTSDFRLIAATNRDLETMVQGGQFRKDLLFRLKASAIHLPPLKERPTDIEVLALHYINVLCKRYGSVLKGVSPEFMQTLQDYVWPGNVRELINAIDCAIANAQGHEVLFPIHLPTAMRICLKRQTIRKNAAMAVSRAGTKTQESQLPSLKSSLEETEKWYLQSLMIRVHGDIKAACRVSGLSRSGLYARLKKYSIARPA
ncbi:Fis family transcriptional regulator [Desulfosarcina alkanivorans]|uniref:Fis family transcriptional regulator n=1 Tax=Desulfosarcina alkanivorans TaxID=571177 RepID=A0A5K7YDZ2_9BACT|nr:sigma-54 dependent transcriptional regulator [Desulfosarcina alkanivorans]BBO66210.1 Fis family transcriptional regulator [Desulfosarcina alkanivorans]